MIARVRVLIIDDSAFARKVVREMLIREPWIDVVGSARDGEEGLEAVERDSPDLVVCDLRMPHVNGAEFVRRQMARRALPIVILSAAAQNAAEVIDALHAGAVAVVQKPTALATEQLRSVSGGLVETLQEVMQIRPQQLRPQLPSPGAQVSPDGARVSLPAVRSGRLQVIVLGISTGGPQALRQMLPRLPAEFPVPIAIVLHMPVGYTALYAEKLNELCALEVKEAAEGDLLSPGRILIAPAGRHLKLLRAPHGEVVARLSLEPLEKIHRPSADVLFRSAAETYRDRVLAIVMTGMGDDGKEGAAWVKAQGGTVLTEAERSCVIYGMPRSVAEAGLSDAAVPLEEMHSEIIHRL